MDAGQEPHTKTVEVKATQFGGIYYYTVNEFAFLIGKTPQSVYHAAKNGKGKNRLKHTFVLNKLLIEASEVDRINGNNNMVDANE